MIAYDKRLHLEAGFIITSIVGSVLSPGWGLLAGVLAGIGKEGYDEYKFRKGEHPVGADKRDMIFTFAGSILGLLIV